MDEQKIEIIIVSYILSKMKLNYDNINGNKLFMSYLSTALKEIKNTLPNLKINNIETKIKNDWSSDDTHAVLRLIVNTASLLK